MYQKIKSQPSVYKIYGNKLVNEKSITQELLNQNDKSFKDLLDEKIISNSSFNTLIVIGDARNNYRPINTETIDKLSKKFYNILDESRKKSILEHR